MDNNDGFVVDTKYIDSCMQNVEYVLDFLTKGKTCIANAESSLDLEIN